MLICGRVALSSEFLFFVADAFIFHVCGFDVKLRIRACAEWPCAGWWRRRRVWRRLVATTSPCTERSSSCSVSMLSSRRRSASVVLNASRSRFCAVHDPLRAASVKMLPAAGFS